MLCECMRALYAQFWSTIESNEKDTSGAIGFLLSLLIMLKPLAFPDLVAIVKYLHYELFPCDNRKRKKIGFEIPLDAGSAKQTTRWARIDSIREFCQPGGLSCEKSSPQKKPCDEPKLCRARWMEEWIEGRMIAFPRVLSCGSERVLALLEPIIFPRAICGKKLHSLATWYSICPIAHDFVGCIIITGATRPTTIETRLSF